MHPTSRGDQDNFGARLSGDAMPRQLVDLHQEQKSKFKQGRALPLSGPQADEPHSTLVASCCVSAGEPPISRARGDGANLYFRRRRRRLRIPRDRVRIANAGDKHVKLDQEARRRHQGQVQTNAVYRCKALSLIGIFCPAEGDPHRSKTRDILQEGQTVRARLRKKIDGDVLLRETRIVRTPLLIQLHNGHIRDQERILKELDQTALLVGAVLEKLATHFAV